MHFFHGCKLVGLAFLLIEKVLKAKKWKN